MTLERAGRWWPGREMAMLRREAEAERWQRMTYDEKVAEQAAARRESRRRLFWHYARMYERMYEQEEAEAAAVRRRLLGLLRFRVASGEEIPAWQLTQEQFEERRAARERWRKGVGRWPRWQVRPPERRT